MYRSASTILTSFKFQHPFNVKLNQADKACLCAQWCYSPSKLSSFFYIKKWLFTSKRVINEVLGAYSCSSTHFTMHRWMKRIVLDTSTTLHKLLLNCYSYWERHFTSFAIVLTLVANIIMSNFILLVFALHIHLAVPLNYILLL